MDRESEMLREIPKPLSRRYNIGPELGHGSFGLVLVAFKKVWFFSKV